MSLPKNKYDVVQYCLRLNLTIPEHLEVHKILQNLNKDVYKSQTSFVVSTVLEYMRRYSDEEVLADAAAEKRKKEKYLTVAEFDSYKASLKQELLQEITSLLISSLSKSGTGIQINTNQEVVSSKSESSMDDTLVGLANKWA